MFSHRAALSLLLLSSLALAQSNPPATAPAPTAFTLSKRTTYIDNPLLHDGRPDYTVALDETLRKNVTAENNAVTLIVEAFGTGPEIIPEDLREQFLKRLAINQPVAAPFQTYPEFANDPSLADDRETQILLGRCFEAPWDPEKFPQILKWIEANNESLDHLCKAAARDRFYWPLFSTSDKAPLLSINRSPALRIRFAAEALVCRAMLRIHQGKFDGAQSDILAAHRLARLLSQGPTLYEKGLAGWLENGISLAEVALAKSLPTADACKTLLAARTKLPPFDGAPATGNHFERFAALDAIIGIRLHGSINIRPARSGPKGDIEDTEDVPLIPKDLDFNCDAVLIHFNDLYDRLAAARAKPTHAERQFALAAIDVETEAAIKRTRNRLSATQSSTQPDPDDTALFIDYFRANMLSPRTAPSSRVVNRARQRSQLCALAIALHGYKKAHGIFPAKLAELTPDFLPAIPKDAFTDAPLSYTSDGKSFTLYGVGPPSKESQGAPTSIVLRAKE